MKLLLFLMATFICTLIASATASMVLYGSGELAGLAGLAVIPPLTSSLLATWITMSCKRPLWCITGGVGVVAAWTWGQPLGGVLSELRILVAISFVLTSVPLLLMRAFGYALIDVRSGYVASCSPDTSARSAVPSCHSNRQWTLSSMLSLMTAVALNATCFRFLLARETVQVSLLLFGSYFAFLLPLMVTGDLATNGGIAAVGSVALAIYVVVCLSLFLFFWSEEWRAVLATVAVPTVCLGIGVRSLHLGGFRLAEAPP